MDYSTFADRARYLERVARVQLPGSAFPFPPEPTLGFVTHATAHEIPVEQLSGCVQRGAELLDERWNFGDSVWHRRVDPELLHLNSARSCVLGQVYGDYLAGTRRLRISHDTAAEFGFMVCCPLPRHTRVDALATCTCSELFTELDRLWLAELGVRLGAADDADQHVQERRAQLARRLTRDAHLTSA